MQRGKESIREIKTQEEEEYINKIECASLTRVANKRSSRGTTTFCVIQKFEYV